MASAPPSTVGRYALFDVIASGGMAQVHFGRLKGAALFSRAVAIKRLHPHHAADEDVRTMFLDEARLAARVRHPNVVPTLDVVDEGGEIFLVMEYVHGESLSRLLAAARARRERIPPSIVAAVVSGMLHGLHAAHEATDETGTPLGIVHRDVSPHNVLVGADGVARVVDFGIAKASARLQDTREGHVKGKLSYMAPEQIRCGNVDRRTDVYAAGVVLWEALTADRLFEGDNDAMVMERVLVGFVEPPSAIVTGLPRAFDDACLRALDANPEKRFGSAREMALALEKSVSIATASEIGEWVATTAGERLKARAARVAEIESGAADTSPAVAVALAGRGEQMETGASQVSSLSVATPHPSTRPIDRRSRVWMVLVAVMSAALTLLVVSLLGARRASDEGPRLRAPASAPVPVAPPASVTATPSSSATASDSAPAPSSKRVPWWWGQPPATGWTSASAPAPPASTTPPPNPCDPPFTRDAKGTKIWKRGCL